MATSLEAINQLTDNIYDYLANLDGQLYQQALIDQGADAEITKNIGARVVGTSTFLQDPFYQQFLEATQTPSAGTRTTFLTGQTFTLAPTTTTEPTTATRALEPTPTPITTTTPPPTTLAEPVIEPTPTVPTAEQLAGLSPEMQTALNLQYTADNNLLLTQENQLLYAILTTLQIATLQGGAAMQLKEFPGFTTTGQKTYFQSDEQVPQSLSRFYSSGAIPYPFVIRHIYASSQTYGDINVGQFNISVEGAGQTKNSTTNRLRPIWKSETTFKQLGLGQAGILNLPLNYVVPDANLEIYWELHNGQGFDAEQAALIIIERLIPDAEFLNIA